MSENNTRIVSRSEAIELLRSRIRIDGTNKELGEMLDKLYSSKTLENYVVLDNIKSDDVDGKE